ncbi:hypothetical protein GCM10009077_30950 [Roseibium denhamense]
MTGDLASQVINLEIGDLVGPAFALEDLFPRDIDVAAQRRHHAKTSYDYSPHTPALMLEGPGGANPRRPGIHTTEIK